MMISINNELPEGNARRAVGILVAENRNIRHGDALQDVRLALEAELREKYGSAARAELKALHPMDAYVSYYKKFGYTYHVLPQLESVARGKSIPGGLALVEVMFLAELKNMLLTAGHDLDRLKAPLRLQEATGQENYITLSGKTATTISGDMMISDGESVISSILRGPDRRTAVTAQTSRALYTVYAPPGVEEALIHMHLSDLEEYIRLLTGGSAVCQKKIIESYAVGMV